MLYMTEDGDEVFLYQIGEYRDGDKKFCMLSNTEDCWDLKDCEPKIYREFGGRYSRGWFGRMRDFERAWGIVPLENEE